MKPDPRGSAFAAGERGADAGGGSGAVALRTSLLGPTVVLRGELRFEEPLVVQGQIHGSAKGSAPVFIKKSAQVSGDIAAESIQFEEGARLHDVVLTGRIQRTSSKRR